MNPNDVAPMVMGVVFFVMTGAVIILRPIAKRLGNYLEVLADERRRALEQKPSERIDTTRVVSLLESLDQRLVQLEERQEFTDKLLVERSHAATPGINR